MSRFIQNIEPWIVLLIFLSIRTEFFSIFWLTVRLVINFRLKAPVVNDYGLIQYSSEALAVRLGLPLIGGFMLTAAIMLLSHIWKH